MLYVTHVESNAKGGVDCDLGPRTFIHGPNESGKSAVQNALEIALSGRASDVFGRAEMAKENELIAHLAPGRKGELYARAFLSDSSQAVWQAGVKGAKRAVHNVPPSVDKNAVFPLRPVREAILGNAETARKFFLQFAVGAVTERDVLDRIPESLHANYRRAVLAAGLADAPVDKLLLALDKAKKEKKAANDRAKASKAASADAAQGLAPLPTDESLQATTKAFKEAKAKLESLNAATAAAGALDRTREQFAALKVQVGAAEAENTRAQAALSEAEERLKTLPTPATVDEAFTNLVKVIDWHAGLPMPDGGLCRVCGREGTSPAHYAARQAAARAFAEKVKTEGASYQHAVGMRDAAKMTALTAADRLQTLKVQEQAMANALAAASQGGGPDPAAVAAAQADFDRLDKALKDVDVLKAQWSSSKKAAENANEAEEEAHKWGKLADACVEAIAKLLDTGVVNFAARVQSHLPADDKFRITLRDGDRAVFQFGLEKEGGLVHTALSGAAWARVTAAVADACAPAADKLSVVVPPPGEFDADTLGRILTAFADLRSQVIICSPILPANMPAGWTVIDTGRLGHRAGRGVAVKDVSSGRIDTSAPIPAPQGNGPRAEPEFDAPVEPPPLASKPAPGDDGPVPPQPAPGTAPTLTF